MAAMDMIAKTGNETAGLAVREDEVEMSLRLSFSPSGVVAEVAVGHPLISA